MAKRGPTPRRLGGPRIHTIEGIPGTVEYRFKEREIIELPLSEEEVAFWPTVGIDPIKDGLRRYKMGHCNIIVAREPAGPNGEPLWHLTISTPSRHPTWDEIKVARYRLLPLDITFGMLLPPPEQYVNVPEQDHVFQLWEIHDPRGNPGC